MRYQFMQALAALLAANGLAWGQMPNTYTPLSRSAPAFTASRTSEASTNSIGLGAPVAIDAAPATSCDHGCCGSRVWASAEYLVWWLRPGNLPSIVGTIPGALAGVSPLPDNAINPVFGGEANRLNYDEHSGHRFSLGLWINADRTIGIDGNYWKLERRAIGFAGSSDGDPVLGPTFFDPIAGRETIAVLSEPGRLTSTVSARATDRLWGFETNARFRGTSVFTDRLDWLFGFRHVQFDEDLLVVSTSTFLPTVPGVGGNRLLVVDSFAARNRFYGVQLGLNGDVSGDRWFLNWSAKLAVGATHERVTILGSAADTTPAGVTTPFPGGILAQPTNIGSRSNDEAAVLGELTINVGYRITPRLRTFIGYNFFQLSEVARAGNQIDDVDSRALEFLTTFDPTATPTRPRPTNESTYLWAHGINLGVEFRY